MQSHISHNLTAIFSQGIKNVKHLYNLNKNRFLSLFCPIIAVMAAL